jgi:hypothetical protein
MIIEPTLSFTSKLHKVNSKIITYSTGDSNNNINNSNDNNNKDTLPRNIRRAFLASSAAAGIQLLYANLGPLPSNAQDPTTKFQRVSPIQFIAALGDPNASSGNEAQSWGLWTLDPGPRGVSLSEYSNLMSSIKRDEPIQTPSGWTLDTSEFWLEEHGLIMEPPVFPMPSGKYIVTGGRQTTAILNIDTQGNWELINTKSDNGGGVPAVKLYDVTHLPCRAARYKDEMSNDTSTSKSIERINPRDFPVKPGALMPDVHGCSKLDYAVLFIIGKAARN